MNSKDGQISLHDQEVSLDLALSGANQISQRLNALSSSIGPNFQSLQFYTRIRSKTKSSIAEKAIRKQNDKKNPRPHYNFRWMTDLVGFRVVTLSDEGLNSSLEYITSILDSGASLSEPLFDFSIFSNTFIESRFYARKENDLYYECASLFEEYIDLKYVEENDGPKELFNKKIQIFPADSDSYSSAHFIFIAKSYVGNDILHIPVEFQLRTAVEDIWAELNHDRVYKLRDHYAWSQGFEKSFQAVEESSDQLKLELDRLSKLVESFSKLSTEANRKLEEFDDMNWIDGCEDPLKVRRLIAHSFGVYLFFQAGEQGRNRFIELFDEYQTQIDAINKIDTINIRRNNNEFADDDKKNFRDLIEGYEAALKILRKVKLRIQDDAKNARNLDFSKLCEQRNSICNLEILRLKSSAKMNHRIGFQSRAFDFDTDEINEENEYRKLYTFFCKYFEGNGSPIRPYVMLYYWKHLVSGYFDKNISRQNLIKSYNILSDDKTLPEESIYKTLVPRSFASTLYLEAKSLNTKFIESGSEDLSNSEIYRMIVEKLSFGLLLAVQAHEAYSKISNKRGDLRLGFERSESFQIFETLFDVMLFDGFSVREHLPRLGTRTRLRVSRMLKYGQENSGPICNNDSSRQGKFTDRLASAEQIFKEIDQ